MAKYLILFILIIFYGCETSSEQVIKSKNYSIENIKFNAVTKKLLYNDLIEDKDKTLIKTYISKWFNNNIKLDGFEGELVVNVRSLIVDKIKEDQFYKYQIDISIDFTERNQLLNYKKTYNVNSIEYGIINGDFTINDQDRLNINIVNKSIESITNKLINLKKS